MKIQKALHRVRVHEDLDYRFLYYWFLWAGKRGELQQYFTGATIKHMPGDKLKSVIITKPDIEAQRQIADVLSAYDDLIENNQKQIKLLEEAAQRLYKEWFVDLRFPGYETTQQSEGIPDGWEIVKLSDIANVIMGQSPKSEFYNQNSRTRLWRGLSRKSCERS
jgi:type I restriction enzyme S subunit